MNLFRDGCRCPSTADIARAGIVGELVAPLCTIHQADEMQAHKAAQEREHTQRRLARETAIFEDLRQPPEPAPVVCSCSTDDIRAALEDHLVPACEVHRPAQPEGSHAALNGDGLTQTLASAVGATSHTE